MPILPNHPADPHPPKRLAELDRLIQLTTANQTATGTTPILLIIQFPLKQASPTDPNQSPHLILTVSNEFSEEVLLLKRDD